MTRPNEYVYVIAGEDEPFLTKTKATYLRLGEALLYTGSSLLSSFSTSGWHEKGDFIVSLKIPVKNVPLFKNLAQCSLRYTKDIQVGPTKSKSTKWVDKHGVEHQDPHPTLDLGAG